MTLHTGCLVHTSTGRQNSIEFLSILGSQGPDAITCASVLVHGEQTLSTCVRPSAGRACRMCTVLRTPFSVGLLATEDISVRAYGVQYDTESGGNL